MFVPICNRFHTRKAISDKITSFNGVPLFDALVRGKLPLSGAWNFVTINYRFLGAAHSEDFVILACIVLLLITSVTDGQTPRRWLRRAKHSANARKKTCDQPHQRRRGSKSRPLRSRTLLFSNRHWKFPANVITVAQHYNFAFKVFQNWGFQFQILPFRTIFRQFSDRQKFTVGILLLIRPYCSKCMTDEWADWHELMISRRIMRSSIARAS